ncbi:MAG: hypothetical protein LLG06_05700 [Desulfobacteraceae bacterium]|nr:hypothetical protein [Desulfobacteraceae bacterium]
MKKIDLNSYKRKELFEAFIVRNMPQLSITSNVVINGLKEFVDKHDYGFFIPISFFISKAVNRVAELRQRISSGELYEFDTVDPSYTVLLDDSTFSFCNSKHFESFERYREYASSRIKAAKECPDHSTGEKNHMYFVTNIPWFSFTSIVHPYFEQYGSIPVISIGKFFNQGNDLLVPIGIQVHHAIVDGIHLGAFYEHLAAMCKDPEAYLE